mmetsp:Transcript_122146/g.304849  ORF Transcript_122146/g.304849 Transcript_122146/m.304849 type:complete len:244 (+) Transcript_122146:419-1150(+)
MGRGPLSREASCGRLLLRRRQLDGRRRRSGLHGGHLSPWVLLEGRRRRLLGLRGAGLLEGRRRGLLLWCGRVCGLAAQLLAGAAPLLLHVRPTPVEIAQTGLAIEVLLEAARREHRGRDAYLGRETGSRRGLRPGVAVREDRGGGALRLAAEPLVGAAPGLLLLRPANVPQGKACLAIEVHRRLRLDAGAEGRGRGLLRRLRRLLAWHDCEGGGRSLPLRGLTGVAAAIGDSADGEVRGRREP